MRILAIADLHVGCLPDVDPFRQVMLDIFDRELNRSKTNAVVFLGDFFDRLFKANERYVGLALDIMSNLAAYCRKNRIKLRLIYGTESHEMSQYQIFRGIFSQPGLDVRVIERASEEELAPGVKVLYLPEEYVTDKATHYAKYFNGDRRYDYVFGHGVIEDGWPTPLTDSPSEGREKHVPRFKSKELLGSGKLVLFGHYHCHTDFYLGSLFRWKFGEDTPKGYAIIEDGKLNFVENEAAYPYRTYEFPENSEVFTDLAKLKAELDRIERDNDPVISGKTGGKVRLKLNLPSNLDPSFTEVIGKLTAGEKRLTVTATAKADSFVNEVASEIESKYDFILDKSLPLAEKIRRYVELEFQDTELTAEDIEELVND